MLYEYQNRTSTAGQATLALVFLVGGIAITVGVSLAFLVISFTNSAFSYQAANRALAIASAGANDALLQLARNGNFRTASFPGGGYCVDSGDAGTFCDAGSALVQVANGAAAGTVVVTSRASVSNTIRKIEVVAAMGSSTQVSVLSWRLLQLTSGGGPPQGPE